MFQPYPTNVCLLITYGVYIRMLVRSKYYIIIAILED